MNILYKLILFHTLARSLQGRAINQANQENSSATNNTDRNDSILIIDDKVDQNKTINFINPIFKIKNLNIYIQDKVNLDFQGVKKSLFRIPKKVKIIVKNGTKTLKPPNGLIKLFGNPNSKTDAQSNILRADSQLFPEINSGRESYARDTKELGFNIEPLGNKYHRQILSNDINPHNIEENSTLPEEAATNPSSHVDTLFKMTASLGNKIDGLIRRVKGNLSPIKENFKNASQSLRECAQKGAQLVMEGIGKTFDQVKSSDLIRKLEQRLEEGGEKVAKFFRNFGQREKEIKDPFKFLVEDGVLSEKDLRDLLNFYQNKFAKKNS